MKTLLFTLLMISAGIVKGQSNRLNDSLSSNFNGVNNFDGSSPASNSIAPTVTNAYPSPASSFTAFNYHFGNNAPSKAIVYNIIGEKIGEFALGREGTLRIDLHIYDSGIYFCSFINGGKTIATKRFTVK